MVFTSFNFLIFFPLVTILYWVTPAKYRWVTLLLTSYFFYINIKPVYAILLVAVTLSTYIFTRLIDNTNIESRKKIFMRINIVLILLPLFFFKYFSAINHEMFSFLESYHVRWPLPEIRLFLPIGISFYTFMAIGYTIDVYNEEIECEKNPGMLALFISFFPLILSGPIERAKNMLPQFNSTKTLDYGMVVKGLKLMLWGYFMKLVVADRLGMYIDTIYNNISHHNGTSLLFAVFLYPFQVYGDLGGYSLIAIGTAKILGFDVMRNFKRPFFSTSMSEFWRRWHISLISWLTDYVFTPLSFILRRYKEAGIIMALIITFVISGLWHGAALTFIAWGFMQSLFLSIETVTNRRRFILENKYNLTTRAWYIFLGCASTFILFAASQVFGRALDFHEALFVYHRIFSSHGPLYIPGGTWVYTFIGLVILFFKDLRDEYFPTKILLFENRNIVIRFSAYLFIFILILLVGVFDNRQFIYFKF